MNTLPVPTQKFRRLRLIGKFIGLGLLVLFGLIALLLAGISMKGRWDLAETKKQLLAQGEKLTLTELASPPLPDRENFFADPMWVELADLVPSDEYPGALTPRLPKGERQLDGLQRVLTEEEQTSLESQFPEFALLLAQTPELDAARKARNTTEKEPGVDCKRTAEFILAVQAVADPLLSRILSLTERERAKFPIRTQERFAANIWPLQYLIATGQFLRTKVWAEIELGQSDSARRHILAIFKLSDTLAKDPVLISLLVRTSLVSLALLSMDEGIKKHIWTDKDLMEFDNCLASINLRLAWILALRGERGGFNEMVNPSLSPYPQATGAGASLKGVFPQLKGFFPKLALNGYLQIFGPGDQVAFNRIMGDAITAAQGWPNLRLQNSSMFQDDFRKDRGIWFFTHILTSLALPALAGSAERITLVQTQVDQTRIACALERFRIARGEYPESQSFLVPQFLAEPILDGITGEPMFYRKLPNGEFLLWSVGGNKSNEAGVPGKTKSEGDWVWGERIR